MMLDKWSRLEIDGVVLEDTAARGIRERRTWVHAAQVERDVNGNLMVGSAMKSPWGKKAHYIWDAAGPGVLDLPAFDHLEYLDVLTVTPIEPWSATIPAGVTTFVLPRTPKAGSTKVYAPDRTPIAPTVNGKQLTFAAQPGLIKVEFLPLQVVALLDFDREVDEDKAQYSWRLEVEEI